MSVQGMIPANLMKGMPVRNYKNQHLGCIEDVMIDPASASIAYAVLSYGGIFGTALAGKRFAVPFDTLAIEDTDDDEVIYRLDMDAGMLKKAPGFGRSHPSFAGARFTRMVDEYYADTPRRVA